MPPLLVIALLTFTVGTQTPADSASALVAAALDHALEPHALPARKGFPRSGPLLLLAELPSPPGGTIDGQNLRQPKRWTLRTRKQLQQLADQTKKSVAFVSIRELVEQKERAFVVMGIETLSPSPKKDSKPKAASWCMTRDQYVPTITHSFRFISRLSMLCS